uniref:Uncharacterized protein n=1 Tax=Hyaloperonospora arabidopsidis (strain Emoy2) TaxID=559515 RepID=M4BCT7_HYAAE
MAELNKDVEALDRVLFRLASVDDERMLQVLQSLLPQLLVLYPQSVSTSIEQQLKEKVRAFGLENQWKRRKTCFDYLLPGTARCVPHQDASGRPASSGAAA